MRAPRGNPRAIRHVPHAHPPVGVARHEPSIVRGKGRAARDDDAQVWVRTRDARAAEHRAEARRGGCIPEGHGAFAGARGREDGSSSRVRAPRSSVFRTRFVAPSSHLSRLFTGGGVEGEDSRSARREYPPVVRAPTRAGDGRAALHHRRRSFPRLRKPPHATPTVPPRGDDGVRPGGRPRERRDAPRARVVTPKTHAEVPLARRRLAVHAERAVLTHRRADGGVAAMKRDPRYAPRVPRERRVRVKRRRSAHERSAERARGPRVGASTNQLLHLAHIAATRGGGDRRVDARNAIKSIAIVFVSLSTRLRSFGRGVKVRTDVAEREERARRARGGGDVQRRSTEVVPRVFLRRAVRFRSTGSKRGDVEGGGGMRGAGGGGGGGVEAGDVGDVSSFVSSSVSSSARFRRLARARPSPRTIRTLSGVELVPEQEPNHVRAIVRGGDVEQRRAVRWKPRGRVRARVHENRRDSRVSLRARRVQRRLPVRVSTVHQRN